MAHHSIVALCPFSWLNISSIEITTGFMCFDESHDSVSMVTFAGEAIQNGRGIRPLDRGKVSVQEH